MTDSLRARAERLFHDAAELPAEERAAFVRAHAGGDDAVEREALSLLALLDDGTSFLDRSPAPALLAGETAPERIGAYRIVRMIGAGGMGAVYEAEQDNPRRTVALKIIRAPAGMASRQSLARFEREAQVLARLHHPGIAQIYEAGTFEGPAGPQPYFAMELVRGQPLDRAAESAGLDARARLELLARVCDAVEHAHAQGVVHRDLKPANILVDAHGQPKVLDFGVARVTNADIQTVTLQTDVGQLIGTLAYMSPEQIAGDPARIDARSDVYSLGVVLYELLSGRTPHDIKGRSIADAARLIQDEEPTRLSTFDGSMRGDIDTIVAHALEKTHARRYASAAALASDIRRCLADEPISVRPHSTAYQLAKFAKRNRGLVAGVALAFAAMTTGFVVSTALFLRAESSRREAEQRRAEAEVARLESDAARAEAVSQAKRAGAVTEFMTTMFTAARPSQAQGQDILVADLIDQASLRLRDQTIGDPQTEAALRTTLGVTLRGIGQLEEARRELERALALREATLDANHADLLATRHEVAVLLEEEGKYEEALAMHSDVRDRRAATLAPGHPLAAASVYRVANTLWPQQRHAEAEAASREALAMFRASPDAGALALVQALDQLGRILNSAARFEDAEPYLVEAVALARESLGDTHPTTLSAMGNLASLLHDRVRYDDAEPLYAAALDAQRALYQGRDSMSVATTLNNFGILRQDKGDLEGAEAMMTESLQMRRRLLGEQHPSSIRATANMAGVYVRLRRFDRAEEVLREAIDLSRRAGLDDTVDYSRHTGSLGSVLTMQDRLDEAEPFTREACEVLSRTLGDSHPSTLITQNNLVVLLLRQNKLADATPLARENLRLRLEALGPTHPDVFVSTTVLAMCLATAGENEEASRLAAGLLERVNSGESLSPSHLAGVCDVYTRLAERRGDEEDAARWRALLQDARRGVVRRDEMIAKGIAPSGG